MDKSAPMNSKPNKNKKKKKTYGKSKTSTQQDAVKAAKRNVKLAAKQLSGGAAGNTLMVSGGRSDWERIAFNLAVPGANNPTRWSSAFSDLPTAVAAPWIVFDAPWPATATPTGAQMYYTDMVIFAFREAERGYVYYDANPAGANYQYGLQGSVPTSTFAPQAPSDAWVIPANHFTVLYQNVYLHTPTAVAKQSYRPHGDKLFAGAAQGSSGRYFWLDAGVTVAISITSAATGTFQFYADFWTPDGINKNAVSSGVISVSAASPTATGSMNILTSGYYAFSVVNATGATAAGGLQINSIVWSGSASVFAHRCIPGYDLNVGSTEGIRINAVSLMYTNRASDLNRQGEIAGFQAPQSTHWTDFVNGTVASTFSTVSKAQGAVTLSIDNGMYGFLKPTQPEDFDIQSYVDSNAGVVMDSYYPLDHHSSYLVIFAQVTSPTGQDGYFTVSYGIEYQTEDVWRKVSPSEFDRRVYESALDFLKVMPQWHENPLHIAEIWEKVKKGGKQLFDLASKYGPLALKGAKAIASFL